MPNTVVRLLALPFLVAALCGSASSQSSSENVRVKVSSDDYDGTVIVPRWVLSQAAATGLGIAPSNNWSYDDDSLPSSVRMDSDCYEIRVDLSNFDQDRAKIKILDSQTVQVEAKQRYVNRYGTSTSRTVNRRFTVPRTYDVYKSDARVTRKGTMIIDVPIINGNNVRVNKDADRTVNISY